VISPTKLSVIENNNSNENFETQKEGGLVERDLHGHE